MFDHLGTWRSPEGRAPRYFGVALHKPSFPDVDIVERAHEELFRRFDTFITRLHHDGRSHRALVIADESSYEGMLQRLVQGSGAFTASPRCLSTSIPMHRA